MEYDLGHMYTNEKEMTNLFKVKEQGYIYHSHQRTILPDAASVSSRSYDCCNIEHFMNELYGCKTRSSNREKM